MKILLTISFSILFIILGLIDRKTMSKEEVKKEYGYLTTDFIK